MKRRAGRRRSHDIDRAPVVVAAARVGLPSPDADLSPAPRVQQHDIAVAAQAGLLGFLRTAIRAGAVEADGIVATTVREHWLRAATTSSSIEAMILRTAEILDERGVRWRLTKGAALAHLDYKQLPGARTFRDMDLVIHPDDWATTCAALIAAGHRRRTAEPRPGYDARFGKGATLIDPDGLQADLHLRFAVGRFGVTSRPRELFDQAESMMLDGRTIPTLTGPDRLLHACYHLVLGGASGLRVARDVAQLLTVTRVDWTETVDTASRWNAEAVVARGFSNAWSRLGLTESHPAVDWAATMRPTWRDRHAITIFEEERSFRRQALTAVSSLSPTDLPAFVRCHLAPTHTPGGTQ